MDKVFQTMMQLIKSEVFGASLGFAASEDNSASENNSVSERFSEDFLERLFTLSDSHDMAHIVGSALQRNGFLPETPVGERFKKQIFMSVYRYENIKYELSQIYSIFENGHISFIPLKGAVLRDYYPEPWMRTSCDIDILIHKSYTEKAIFALCAARYEQQNDITTHDHSFISPNKVHLELHYTLEQGEYLQSANEVLDTVWQYSTLNDAAECCYAMCDEMFVFYHIAHMAKHFLNGGCGIRPFIDLWLLKGNGLCNSPQLYELLEKAELVTFYETVMKLSEVWLDSAPHDSLTKHMETFILSGGVYGTVSTGAAVKAAQGESKIKSFIKLMLLPRESLEVIYPNLKKHPFLLPFYQIKRWFRIFNRKKRNRISNLIAARNQVNKSTQKNTADLLIDLGLIK